MSSKELMLQKLQEADRAYYEEDNPIMTDAEYDSLRRVFEKDFGPLNYVPGKAVFGRKFRHSRPVISLDKVQYKDRDELKKKVVELWPVVCQFKADGLTIVAYPTPEGSCQFVTRGDGIEGEMLPHFIPRFERIGANRTGYPVRGEAILPEEALAGINAEREKNGLAPFMNARNAAAGILRSMERSPYLDKLQFFAYDLLCPEGTMTEDEKLELIHSKSIFPVIFSYEKDTPDSLIESLEKTYKRLKEQGYPIDGMVIKNNSKKKFGMTNHHPLGQIAVKFEQKSFITTLRSVEWQVGRDSITPVAVFDPVLIDGTRVERASLYNYSNMETLNLHEMDKVSILKANEIIPQIVANESDTHIGKKFDYPKACPICGGELRMDESHKKLECLNELCSEKLAQSMAHIASRKVLNIPGLSIETCRKLVNHFNGDISPWAFLWMKQEDFEKLPGFGPKSALKLTINIAKLYNQPIDIAKLVAATAISGVGNTVGKIISKNFTKEEFWDAIKKNDLPELEGIGPKTRELLLGDKFMEAYIDLTSLFDEISSEKDTKPVVRPNIKSFVITGKLTFPRKVYEEAIEMSGNKFSGAISKTTDYLVTDDPSANSSKLKKARELGIQIINEEELRDILKEKNVIISREGVPSHV